MTAFSALYMQTLCGASFSLRLAVSAQKTGGIGNDVRTGVAHEADRVMRLYKRGSASISRAGRFPLEDERKGNHQRRRGLVGRFTVTAFSGAFVSRGRCYRRRR